MLSYSYKNNRKYKKYTDPTSHVIPAHGNRGGKSSNKTGWKFKNCILNLPEGCRVTKEGMGRKMHTLISRARSCWCRENVSERNIPADTEVLKGALAKCVPLSDLSHAHMCPSIAYKVRDDWLRIGFEYYWFAWPDTISQQLSICSVIFNGPKCPIFKYVLYNFIFFIICHLFTVKFFTIINY